MIDAPAHMLCATAKATHATARAAAEQAQNLPVFDTNDVVEFSADAGGDKQPIRHELVRRIKAEIAADTYVTDAKIDDVVETLHRKLFGR